MRSSLTVFTCLLLLAGMVQCMATSSPPDNGAEPNCEQDKDVIDFGSVAVGEAKVDSVTVSAGDVEGDDDHITYAVTLVDPDFHLWDPQAQQVIAQFDIDLTYPADTTIHVRFAPQSAGQKVDTLVLGNDCDGVVLTGVGVGVAPGDWVVDGSLGVALYDLWGSSTQVFACGAGGEVAHRLGDPGEWTLMLGTGIADVPLWSCWGFEGEHLWVGGGVANMGATYARAWRYDLDAESWSSFDESTMLDCYGSIWGTDDCSLYLGGAAISGDSPNAEYWDCDELDGFIIGYSYDLVSGIFGSGPEDVWAVKASAFDSLYHFDGTSWTGTKEAFMTAALHDVWVAPGGEAFAVGEEGAIYHWNGATWADHTLAGVDEALHGVWGAAAYDVYAVGASASIYHWDGNVWLPQAAPAAVTGTIRAVWGRGAVEVYAVTEGGYVIRAGTRGSR
ncbi:MAG: hypothetical protein JW819_12810 [Candidatus Krumholzibacteriota bacterium]|nr:hypothetical protein [Candidatus Krumholzibacteriota bacterium]